MTRLLVTLILSSLSIQLSASCGNDHKPAPNPYPQGGIIEPAAGGAGGGAGAQGFAGEGGDSANEGGASASEGGAPGTSEAARAVGQPCQAAEDCPAPLTCLTPTSNALESGSPPGGLCTLDCTGSPQHCRELDAHCIDFGPRSYCVEACSFGAPAAATSPKCHDRSDFACEPTYRRVDVLCDTDSDCGADAVCRNGSCHLVHPRCLPRCNGPHDCAELTYCHPVSGECVLEEPTGLPIGAECTPGSQPDPCRGICLDGRCTEFCTLGAAPACGDGAACVLTLASAPGSSDGDQGACAEL